MKDDFREILFTSEQIAERIKELGAEITKDYAGKKLMLLGVLKGCFVFLADIGRHIDLDCEIRFLTASSYGFSSVSSGKVNIEKEIEFNVSGRDVLIIEDILDSGITLTALHALVAKNKPASLKTCTLLDKPERRQVPFTTDYTGFICPNEFVVGYGLDYGESYRNLPYVAVLKPEIYS
ncbi:MAG: hypoxanthine phosphoribosyltransferase [Oscillospiraceae bacterium]|nr:hypoxanthine phosphoribosyltransferase [Oscillospiraceae bacterium]MCL2278562.1 hypoxanthine phosphoribosyltransferase [Oscillospiraceae bacterium]